MPRFKKGSQEAKDYMASIRNNKKGSGFFNNLGKSIKKEAEKVGRDMNEEQKKLEKILKEEQKKQVKILKEEQEQEKKHFLENELVMKRLLFYPLLVLSQEELLVL